MKFSKAYIIEAQLDDLWGYESLNQEHKSDKTSRLQNPSAIQHLLRLRKKNPDKYKGNINADIGGGKYDLGTELLKNVGVNNYIYDPFNRSVEHNKMSADTVRGGKAHTVTVSNVLNVIKEPEIRERVIKQAADAVDQENGVVVFSIYERDKDGVGKPTKDGWQNNLKAKFYIPEIKKHFKVVEQTGDIIVARSPIVTWR